MLLAFTAVAALVSCRNQGGYVSITGFAQGGTYMVKLNLDTDGGVIAAAPEEIKAGIDSIFLVVDNSVSGYNKGSLLSRFNAGETIAPDDIFIQLYNISYKFYELTGGAFDVAAAPLFDAWGFGFKDGEFPGDEEIARLKSRCGMGRLKSDIYEAVATGGGLAPKDLLLDPADEDLPMLNFNAIAQGYSCDLIAQYLYNIGVKDMLVMLGGGEIYCDGLNPSSRPWVVGVDRPVDGNETPGAMLEGTLTSKGLPCGIVTSGNYRKFYIKDGVKYAHSIDPRTGYPVSHSILSATVIAPNATIADVLATYCMVVGMDEAKSFVESDESLSGYFIYSLPDTEDAFGTWASEGVFDDDK